MKNYKMQLMTWKKKQTPPPMHTMLDKQSREEAIAKRKARDSMTCADIPSTNPDNKQYRKKRPNVNYVHYYTQYWCLICNFTQFQPHQLPAPNQKEMHQNARCASSL